MSQVNCMIWSRGANFTILQQLQAPEMQLERHRAHGLRWEVGEVILKAVSSLCLVNLEKSGYMPMLEEQDEFVTAVTNFLLE